jgi:hypothetical protein
VETFVIQTVLVFYLQRVVKHLFTTLSRQMHAMYIVICGLFITGFYSLHFSDGLS